MLIRKEDNWEKLRISPKATILEVAKILEETSVRIALVVEDSGNLVGIVTDGDIRRGLLKGLAGHDPCGQVVNKAPRVVAEDAPSSKVQKIMAKESLVALPMLSVNKKLAGVWVAYPSGAVYSNPVVIMAGGRGTRLRPLTLETPKPLVKVGSRPMLHYLLESLADEGFQNVFISVNYLGNQVEEFVADGSQWKLSVNYLRENSPLGTAGALGLMTTKPELPILILNADVLTAARMADIVGYHTGSDHQISVGMRVHDLEHPFGVLQIEGGQVVGIREKPVWREFVSAGVSVLSPEILDLVEPDSYLDMPDLISLAIEKGFTVGGFPMHESWLDIGTPDDFTRAQEFLGGTDKK